MVSCDDVSQAPRTLPGTQEVFRKYSLNEYLLDGDINHWRKYRGNSKFDGEDEFVFDGLVLSGLWVIQVKMSHVDNGRWGLMLKRES